MSAVLDYYQKAFESVDSSQEHPWVAKMQKKAFDAFKEQGFPTLKHEQWKYLNLSQFVSQEFITRSSQTAKSEEAIDISSYRFGEDWPVLVLVNGRYHEGLSRLGDYEEVVHIKSLEEAVKENPKFVETYFGKIVKSSQHAFAALNTAFVENVNCIFLGQEKRFEPPLQILYVSTKTSEENPMNALRNLWVLQPYSELKVVESYVSLTKEVYFNNSVSEIVLSEGARLDYYRLVDEGPKGYHIHNTAVYQNRNSSFRGFSFVWDGAIVRNDFHGNLDDQGVECELQGLYLPKDKQQVDHHILIDHHKPHGNSQVNYKGIVGDEARAVFNGKVFVHKDAQRTQAEQTNKNILLDEKAVVDTKPELEIYADDVKCAHGAAVGQLEESALFYLKSRGIGEAEARKLLCFGFANEVIETVEWEELRKLFQAKLAKRFES